MLWPFGFWFSVAGSVARVFRSNWITWTVRSGSSRSCSRIVMAGFTGMFIGCIMLATRRVVTGPFVFWVVVNVGEVMGPLRIVRRIFAGVAVAFTRVLWVVRTVVRVSVGMSVRVVVCGISGCCRRRGCGRWRGRRRGLYRTVVRHSSPFIVFFRT